MLGRLADMAYRQFRDRSQIVPALKAFADGQSGTFGPHLYTDGNALWCEGCLVPIALVLCHDCHHIVRIDPMRVYLDEGVITRKLRLWIYLAYLEHVMPGPRVIRGPAMARMQTRVESGDIAPCNKVGVPSVGRPIETFH